jgi:hypothetical protein
MAKSYKPGFIYIKSDLLKQEVAWRKKDGRVFCEDGVQYSPQEMALFEKAGAVLDIATHRVKKVLGGEVVKIERGHGSDFERGQAESQKRDDTADNSDTGGKIPGVAGNGENNRAGELDIY